MYKMHTRFVTQHQAHVHIKLIMSVNSCHLVLHMVNVHINAESVYSLQLNGYCAHLNLSITKTRNLDKPTSTNTYSST